MSVESAELLRRENEEKILCTVKLLLNGQHPSALSLGEVAKRASVSVKTINNIFGTKNSLLIRTAIRAYTEEHAMLDGLVTSKKFAAQTGLEQVLTLHYERAKFQRENPYMTGVISKIERLKITKETEIKQCEQFLALADTISTYYEAPVEKGHADGSIKGSISKDEILPILFFSFGAVTQKLQMITLNSLMDKRVDSYALLRSFLKMTKEYIGT